MRLHTRTRLKTATPTTRRPSLERDVSQLPCNTLERCPSAVRIRIAPSAARRAPASTTSREPRSTNDGGSEPAVPGDDACKHHPRRVLSRGAGSREGWRATRGIAGNAFGHRAGVSARRIHAAAHQPSGARLAATFDAGFLAPSRRGFWRGSGPRERGLRAACATPLAHPTRSPS